MEITFDTKELRDLCADEETAAQKLGSVAAESLKHRISDIRAADSIDEVLAGKPRTGIHEGAECYFIDLPPPFRVAVVPAHGTPRMKPDGSADWSRIRRIKVVSLQP
ncbi:hypothetical protein D8I35_03450 [Corticibacter populi]|uniref:Killer suppression protein HigA n=1 Tax=Corticibacter populi TaxID=1550736 RepID=A0A3M6QZ20_9BURK|nr:hypothetical protein [Corticibacter populi]RMX08181.1 hypothetical protein D8I35_03450 [Corticibacter populi]RZS35447.1 proteic killer suppression protein [Corticibacter populi]